MPMNLTTARDELLGRVKTLIDSIASQDRPVVIYDDAFKETPRGRTDKWCRVGMIHTGGGQASLANHLGKSRYVRRGFILVEIFTVAGAGQRLSDLIGATLLGGFKEATSGGAWFRGPRPEEIGQNGAWYQLNVRVFFEYDEIL